MSQLTLSVASATFPEGSASRLIAEFTAANTNFTELYAADVAEAARATAAEALKATKVIPTYTVTTVPAASANTRVLIHVSDGSAGAPCLALSDGTNWKVVATYGATISAT